MPRRPSATSSLAIALAAATVLAGCGGGTGGDGDGEAVATVDPAAAARAGDAAGCTVTTTDDDLETTHLAPDEAPPSDELYPERPAVGGPHFAEWLVAGVYDAPVEERAAVHNLEHGAVAVYLDPDLADDEVSAVTGWATSRNEAGLLDERTGGGLLVAPFDGPLSPPVAFRAWGVAADCERFDETFADGFVLEHLGTAGDAPEGSLGGDPTAVLTTADDA